MDSITQRSGNQKEAGVDPDTRSSSGAGSMIGCLRWRLILPAGMVVSLLTYGLMFFIITTYADSMTFAAEYTQWGPWDPHATIQHFGKMMGEFGMPILHLLLTVSAAMWVGHRIGANAILHGTLIGLVAAVLNQAMGLIFSPPLLSELVLYPVLGAGGGMLGGLRGWVIRAGEEALYGTSRALNGARSPREITVAIGAHLAGAEVAGISLWSSPDGEREDFELLGSWAPRAPRAARPWPREVRPEARQREALDELHSPLVWRTRIPIQGSSDAWTVLSLPMVSTRGSVAGLLMVASSKRWGFSGKDIRAYSTVAAPAALALENWRLVDRARLSGREVGESRERQRLAHEIHDTLAQDFTSIVMNLEAAEGALPPGTLRARWHLDQARIVAREGLAEARRLVWGLRPESLENSSLPEALEQLTRQWSAASAIAVSVAVTGTPRPLPERLEATLLRVAQEAFANVRKHARASRLALTLSYMEERVVLDARDDGVGFDPSRISTDPGGGFGLKGMRERIEELDGKLLIESEPGEGATLVAEIPVSEPLGSESDRAALAEGVP